MIQPAATGTHRFTAKIGAGFTAGRDFVSDAIDRLFRQTDTLACDIETFGVGVEARKLKSVSFGTADHAVVCDPRDPYQADIIRRTIDRARWLVFHNGVYDIPSLHFNKLLEIRHVNKVIDTIIYSRMATPSDIGGHDLFSAANNYCGLETGDYLKKAFAALGYAAEDGWRIFDLDRPIYLHGAAADVIATARLEPVLRSAAYDQLTTDHPFTNHGVSGEEAWRVVDREQIVNRVLLRRTCKGVVTDLEYLDKYRAETSAKRQEAERELDKFGIKPTDGNSLIKWLVDNDALPEGHPVTKKTEAPSAQAKHLELVPHPVAKLFVQHKKIDKIEKDYLVKCQDLAVQGEDGLYRVFPVTHVLKAATGRAAMADPPLHQFNGPARGILLPDPGDTMVSCDWSAIEPVTVSNLAGEMGAIQNYESGGDFYTGVAEMAGVERKIAKVILLAAMYGEGRVKLAADLNVDTDKAESLQRHIFTNLPYVENFIQIMKQTARNHQKIMTISGRIIPVPSAMYDGRWGVQAHRGVNYVVQGSAYDILAETLVRAEEAGLGDGVYFTMHDEIIMSKEAAPDIRKIMETPPERLCYLSGRVPMLRTDMAEMERWASV